ncbi:acetylxylan esterase, partial [Pseudomonas aeruginosa]
MDRYAEVRAAAGFDVLLDVHPIFGDTDGEPLQEIDPVMKSLVYRDANNWWGAPERVERRRI